MSIRILLAVAVLVLSACAAEPEQVQLPNYPSATQLLDLLDEGRTTSAAVVEEFLQRIERAAALNAFIFVDTEGARLRAVELDELRRRGIIVGPLHGVPLVVKDNIHVGGLTNTAGTPGLAKFTPGNDNAVVAALRDAGAIILAKTNLHELAFGITSDNAAFGSVSNPYDRSLFAGGSSGGTASAIAAGLAPAGLGTDTGGSARIPAALTGVVGFRPSTGRYDSTSVTPISHTRDTIGVIAASVADVVLLDSIASPGDVDVHAADPGELRLGVAREYYFSNLDRESTVVIEAALGKLRDAGVTLVEVDPGNVTSLINRSAFPIALHEVVRDLTLYLEEHATGQDFASIAAAAASPDVQGLFAMLGTPEGQVTQDAYEEALQAREELRAVFRDYFKNHRLDAMIFPTTPLPARPIEGSLTTVELNGEQVPTFATYIRNTDPASIAALPGISLPIGLTAAGLPVGLEIDGPEQFDRKVLEIAVALEKIFAFSAQP